MRVQPLLASMGPLLFRAEDDILTDTGTTLQAASMGPLLFRAEDGMYARHKANLMVLASMGPLLFRAEDQIESGLWEDEVAASMGPLLFRAEDSWRATGVPVTARSLQWGRSCSERKTEDTFGMGRGGDVLQWGRSCSERKTLMRARGQRRRGRASMRPLLFRAEDSAGVGSGSIPPRGFNGAALVQSGRRRPAFNLGMHGPRLQWGRSCSERKTVESNHGVVWRWKLQWGRSCSERKTPSGWSGGVCCRWLQWGRSCSERKTTTV